MRAGGAGVGCGSGGVGMDEDCIAEIRAVLPELNDDGLEALVGHLAFVVGVKEKNHLAFVEYEDLQYHLTKIQSRQMIAAFKPKEPIIATSDSAQPSTAPSPPPATAPLPSPAPSPSLAISMAEDPIPNASVETQSSWIQGFSIPWDKMPATLLRSISKQERANPPDRRAMVRIVVDSMRRHCPNPNRAACTAVARMIVSSHPLTFTDRTVDGVQIGIGYYSLINQLKTRVEHLNRNSTTDRIRKPRTTQDGHVTKPVRSKTDSYGCVNWQPKSIPEGETIDTLEEKRKNLKAIFESVGPRAAEWPATEKCMDVTYAYQRHMINVCPPPSISDLKDQWPVLFTPRGLFSHFKTLTGIEIEDRLAEALQNKGKRIITFFQQQSFSQPNIRALLKEIDNAFSTSAVQKQTGIAAVLLMMKHFLESEESIFMLADACATPTSVERDMDIPITPRLIMLGNTLLTSTRWMVTIEGKVACVVEEHRSFSDALAAFFSSFYVFNIEYQEPACATLEFIQRFMVRINPDEGTKCSAKTAVSRKTGAIVKRKVEPINTRVTTFLHHLTEFEWKET
ncbi:uncharacterized protein LOC134464751 [Engraulis encrasicolus]|uniref:uncharacterized protein LOC134464751 n=1 Tax=Engraulis encrasicolus TaxID=184585 RepID=UPI002FD21CFC